MHTSTIFMDFSVRALFLLQASSMRAPAQRFLIMRALGAPAFVVSLALQGIFRGFKDTKTPVFCLGKFPGFELYQYRSKINFL